MNKEIQDSLDELRLFAARQQAIVNDLETYIEANGAESADVTRWYQKAQEHFKARATLQKVCGDQLAEILTMSSALAAALYRVEDQQKSIRAYQDAADKIVARGKELEDEIVYLKSLQKKRVYKKSKVKHPMANTL